MIEGSGALQLEGLAAGETFVGGGEDAVKTPTCATCGLYQAPKAMPEAARAYVGQSGECHESPTTLRKAPEDWCGRHTVIEASRQRGLALALVEAVDARHPPMMVDPAHADANSVRLVPADVTDHRPGAINHKRK